MDLMTLLKDSRFRKAIYIILLIIIALILVKYVLIGVLMILAVLLALASNVFNFKITGIELTTLTVVISGVVFGPKVGAIIGLIMILVQNLVGGTIGPYNLWTIPTFVLIGFFSGVFAHVDITVLGWTVEFCMLIIFSLCTTLITPQAWPRFGPYALGNIVVNLFLFKVVAPPLLVLIL